MVSFPRYSILVLTFTCCTGIVRADKVVVKEATGERTVDGNILSVDSSGAMLFETRDSQHLILAKDQVVRSEKSKTPTPLWTRSELKAALIDEYGEEFRVTEADKYVIVHSCSIENAREAGRLLNKAQQAFITYFGKQNGFKLRKARQPLVAVVFEGRKQYVDHVARYLGAAASRTLGVYVPSVNRIFLFNAFGGDDGRRIGVAKGIAPAFAQHMAAQILEQNISTLVHEAVHQAAYNTGFHNRNVVDYPLWLVEGMAMFFETTDVNGQQGWKGGKAVNPDRAKRFRDVYLRSPRNGFLEQLLVDDSMLRDPATAADGYALAWTLTYYLLKNHKSEYMEYVRLINSRPEFTPYPRSARLKDFETAFKLSPSQMETEFQAAIVRLLDR